MEKQMVSSDWEGFDPTTAPPFTDGRPYLGQFETGLYPGASNEMPAEHRAAGERMAEMIQPLDVEGRPDANRGRILGLSLGHSNAKMYFDALQAALRDRASELHPRFEFLNAAIGGQMLPQLLALGGPVWSKARELTSQSGYSATQVQVVFLHTTYPGAVNAFKVPPPHFPQTMRQMARDLGRVLEHVVRQYPNTRIAYLTSDGLRHHTGYEPHVWMEAFAVKWLIEDQIRGAAGTAYEGEQRRLPWLTWGPYIWDARWDRSYFTDGVHPAPKALSVFVDRYVAHLTTDSAARPWLRADSGAARHQPG
jgi:hypothetical protein